MKIRSKILVALSGGVDSAVAASILKKQGHEVVGAFFHFFGPSKMGKTDQNRNSAMLIAKKLGIPLKIVDARKEFKKKVINYFVDEYKNGRTPNPCVVCNKEMKFRLLFDLMKKEKADAVATGHYARLRREILNPKYEILNKFKIQNSKFKIVYHLQQASDKTKDQSYFLYRLTQKDLAKIIFPLGNHKKSEVKKLAGKMKLPTLEEESQDICFLLGQDISSYLGKCIKTRKGNIIDSAGKVLGKHKGLPFYTLGQRKGIKIGPPSPRLWRARGTGPYFVVGKNLRRNELVVTNDPEKLLTRKFFVSGVNWVSVRPKFPLRARVQTRYRAGKFSAIIREVRSGKLEVRSEKYLRAVTAGQSAVFYKNGEVLGGGIINHAN